MMVNDHASSGPHINNDVYLAIFLLLKNAVGRAD